MRTVKIILGDEFTMFNDSILTIIGGFTPWKKKHMWNCGTTKKVVYGEVLMPKLALQKCNQ